MHKRQLLGLFIVNTSPYIVGFSALPIFPIKLKELGASESIIGIYLAMIFAGLFLGTLASGWLADYFGTRRPFIFIGMSMMVIGLVMMTQVNTPLTLSNSLALTWFGGGLSGGTVNTLAGLYAEPAKRGQIFGIMGMARGTGGVFGGILGTVIIKHADFETLLALLAAILFSITLIASIIEDRVPVQPKRNRPINEATPIMNGTFLILLTTGVMINSVQFVANLGRPFKMEALALDQSAIITTSIVAGIAGLFAPYLVGWLSDRIDRKQLLIACYGAILTAVIVLSQSKALWHFWLEMTLFSIGLSDQGVGAALITDMTPKEALGAAMSRYTSAPWLGAVIGFGAGGFVIQLLDVNMTFTLLALVPMIVIELIATINTQTRIRVTQTQTQTTVAVAGD